MQQPINNLNKIVSEKMETGVREHISYSQAEEALDIVKTLEINSQEDLLLFCAAMNLLNAYVKQKDSRIGYFFKSYMDYLFEVLSYKTIPRVQVGMDITITKKGGAIAYVIIQIENVQFSFHQIKVTNAALEMKQNSNIVQELDFDGLKKQSCAGTIFEMVKGL